MKAASLMFQSPRAAAFITIGDEGVHAAFFQNGKIQENIWLAADDKTAIDTIKAKLAQGRDVKVTLLVDSAAHVTERSALPKLRQRDRRILAERRLAQTFPGALFRAFTLPRRGKEFAVFHALSANNPLTLWFDALLEYAPRIGLMAVEVSRIAGVLDRASQKGWHVFVFATETGGLWHIVTYDGDYVYARLSPRADRHDKQIAMAVGRDIKALRDYLARFGLHSDVELRATVITDKENHSTLRKNASMVQGLNLLTPEVAEKMLRVQTPAKPDATDDGIANNILFSHHLSARRFTLPLLQQRGAMLSLNAITAMLRRGLTWGVRIAVCVLLFQFAGYGRLLWVQHDLNTELEKLHRAGEGGDSVTQSELKQALIRQKIFSEDVATPWTRLDEMRGWFDDDCALATLQWTAADKGAEEAWDLTVSLPIDASWQQNQELMQSTLIGWRERLLKYWPGYKVTLQGSHMDNGGSGQPGKLLARFLMQGGAQ